MNVYPLLFFIKGNSSLFSKKYCSPNTLIWFAKVFSIYQVCLLQLSWNALEGTINIPGLAERVRDLICKSISIVHAVALRYLWIYGLIHTSRFQAFPSSVSISIGTRSVITRCISVMHFRNGADFSLKAIFTEKGERERYCKEKYYSEYKAKNLLKHAKVFKMTLDN